MAPDSGPDWVVIGGGIATVATVVAGVVAGMRGSFNRQSDNRSARQIALDKAQSARDTTATANASLTLESVFRLVNELQEEVARKSSEIDRLERVCMETKATLLLRIGELEREVGTLEREVRSLRAQIP